MLQKLDLSPLPIRINTMNDSAGVKKKMKQEHEIGELQRRAPDKKPRSASVTENTIVGDTVIYGDVAYFNEKTGHVVPGDVDSLPILQRKPRRDVVIGRSLLQKRHGHLLAERHRLSMEGQDDPPGRSDWTMHPVGNHAERETTVVIDLTGQEEEKEEPLKPADPGNSEKELKNQGKWNQQQQYEGEEKLQKMRRS
ncbi:hypothetical protein L914_00010 [Phytophthora nicotianae]|uniref:Uncharacterized protein n=1 Tax=Phytophthora nicotianae TaxID=4792 RepID=W2P8G4_PHYNI|nr:hypothetical protein L914_00010 [Phytophthora nicotianae]